MFAQGFFMLRGFAPGSDMMLIYAARIVALLTAIPLHESAHAWVSYKLGDPTGRNMGRISMNPARHFDLLGSLCMLLLGFGWAKPVPVDTRYYANRKAGMAVSSLAGPLSNVLMAFFCVVFYKVFDYIGYFAQYPSGMVFALRTVFSYMAAINVLLAVFNMLPVPPFDGSRIFLIFLPERLYFGIMKIERYIVFVVFALLWSGYLGRPLVFMQSGVMRILDSATQFVDVIMRMILASSLPAVGIIV